MAAAEADPVGGAPLPLCSGDGEVVGQESEVGVGVGSRVAEAAGVGVPPGEPLPRPDGVPCPPLLCDAGAVCEPTPASPAALALAASVGGGEAEAAAERVRRSVGQTVAVACMLEESGAEAQALKDAAVVSVAQPLPDPEVLPLRVPVPAALPEAHCVEELLRVPKSALPLKEGPPLAEGVPLPSAPVAVPVLHAVAAIAL